MDTEGAVLLEKESSEKAGQELSVSSPPIDGYIPQEEEKSFIVSRKEDNNLVIFVYDKESLPTTCTVLCKDTEGNILDSHTVDGLAGETFTASAPDLDEYILQEEEQDSCTLTLSEDADSNQIVFTYEKIYLTFNDPALEYAVRRSMNLTGSTRGISFAEAKSVGELNLSGALENNYGMIKDLTGLSAFTGLKKLDLGDNLVADVSELENLTDLEWLCLEKNRIKDITPLKNLRRLTHLDLYLNNIEDASPAMLLTNLTMLDLRDNNISTVDGIKSLTKLKQLYLGKNHIRDISQLKELYDLDYLSLGNNEVEDISMLKDLQKIAVLAVPNNKIKDISVVTGFPLRSSTGWRSTEIRLQTKLRCKNCPKTSRSSNKGPETNNYAAISEQPEADWPNVVSQCRKQGSWRRGRCFVSSMEKTKHRPLRLSENSGFLNQLVSVYATFPGRKTGYRTVSPCAACDFKTSFFRNPAIHGIYDLRLPDCLQFEIA